MTPALHAEWIKFWSVRSTRWSLAMMLLVGAGLTTLVCALSADWLASDAADEAAGSFITWGIAVAQVTAVVLGAMVVTSEYGTGLVRATLAAMPRRGTVLLAKVVVLTGALLVVGTLTAVVGYLGGNAFLEAEGVGLSLGDDGVLRSLVGSGLYMAALGLLAAGVGLLVRSTAAALSIVLGTVFVVGNMVFLLPGAWGEWIAKLLPGNAGSSLAAPVSFNPGLLGPWTGYGVLLVEVAIVLGVGALVFQRRDA